MTRIGGDMEQALEFLAGRTEEMLGFARDLIATPSPNPPGGERAVADLVVARLEALGVDDVVEVGESPQRPNLIARVAGDRPGRSLVLSGHIDTKPPGDLSEWVTDPWDPVLRDGELAGLGSGDMKVAVAAMVYAAAAVRRAGGFAGELQLVFTADEEAGSALGSKWLAENGHLSADVAVIGEPSGIIREWEAIHLVSRGAALFKVKVRGTQMHSSISDRLPGVNASVEMARLMDRMDRELPGRISFQPHPLCPTGPTLNVGVMVQGGVFYGVYPGYAEFACDLRTLPGMTRESVEGDLRSFLTDAMADAPDLRAELDIEMFMPATEIPADDPIVAALQWAAGEVLDEPPELSAFPGATDAAHFTLGAGIPCIAAFGPGMLPRAHGPNEYLAAAGVHQAARIYALAALRYLA